MDHKNAVFPYKPSGGDPTTDGKPGNGKEAPSKDDDDASKDSPGKLPDCTCPTGDPVLPGETKGEDSTDGSKDSESAQNRRNQFSRASFRSELEEVDYDQLSQLSLYMVRDFRYFFQHPYLRLMIAYTVIICNFLIYAEDPLAHSVKESSIPIIGTTFAFVCTKYPHNAWSLLKVVLWLLGLLTGLIGGKAIHYYLLNRKFRLKMFHEDHGSWMTMFFTCIMSVYFFSWVYNLFLLIGGASTATYHLSSLMGVPNSFFMKAAACGTWLGDGFTAWMVTDMMLQEHLYPKWAQPIRTWWKAKLNRIILFWIVMLVSSLTVITVITTDKVRWDWISQGFFPTNELSRAFLASLILIFDLTIVMQDWDFPHFINCFEIKLPGMNTAHMQFSLPKFLRKPEWRVHITGKWFNYGILMMVMMLDLNMWKNQIFYKPYDHGQYVDPDGRVYTITNKTQLEAFNETELTYEWRSENNDTDGEPYINQDIMMYSKYFGFSMPVKAIAFVPSLAAFTVFGSLIAIYGRFPPVEKNPYKDRMRKKRRLLLRSASQYRHTPHKTSDSQDIMEWAICGRHGPLDLPVTPDSPTVAGDHTKRSQKLSKERGRLTRMATIDEQTHL